MAAQKLTLFIDAQNFYNGARRAFFNRSDPCYFGQFKPIELANIICSRSSQSFPRIIHEVRIYTGRPDATKEPQTYAAHMKQCHSWNKAGAKVIPRPLRYSDNWPNEKPQQKGVDVAMAIDFVACAFDCEYEVGVVASADTDLRPALEFVYSRFATHCHIEVAAWTSPRTRSRLSVPGLKIWCHWLNRNDYDSIADLTDYNI